MNYIVSYFNNLSEVFQYNKKLNNKDYFISLIGTIILGSIIASVFQIVGNHYFRVTFSIIFLLFSIQRINHINTTFVISIFLFILTFLFPAVGYLILYLLPSTDKIKEIKENSKKDD